MIKKPQFISGAFCFLADKKPLKAAVKSFCLVFQTSTKKLYSLFIWPNFRS